MQLREYLRRCEMTVAFFAREIGIAECTVFGMMRGKTPNLKTAVFIEDYTRGMVRVRDLLGNVKHGKHAEAEKKLCQGKND